MHSQGAGTARDTEKCSGQASCRQFPSADLHLLGDLLGQSRALPGQGLLGTKSFLFQALGLQLPPKSGSPISKLSSMTLKSMQTVVQLTGERTKETTGAQHIETCPSCQ